MTKESSEPNILEDEELSQKHDKNPEARKKELTKTEEIIEMVNALTEQAARRNAMKKRQETENLYSNPAVPRLRDDLADK